MPLSPVEPHPLPQNLLGTRHRGGIGDLRVGHTPSRCAQARKVRDGKLPSFLPA